MTAGISVCVPATRVDSLMATIKSIRGQAYTNWELIVVSQRQNEVLRQAVQETGHRESRLRHVEVDEPGLSHARNAALRAAVGSVIAMTDDDCEADPQWLTVIAESFSRDPDLGLVGGALVEVKPANARLANCPHVEPAEALYDPATSPRRPPDGFDWAGANFAIRRKTAELAGPFDELLGAGVDFASCEDVDYKFRLESLGVRMLATPRAVVVHTNGCRIGLRALIRYQRGHARGTGGMAGKLTLLGDPRGRQWLDQTRDRCLGDWLRRRPHRLPIDLAHVYHFISGYRDCVRGFAVDDAGLLTPRRRLRSV
jgi:glycosyltransferase involved in cell wall biosynthesis